MAVVKQSVEGQAEVDSGVNWVTGDGRRGVLHRQPNRRFASAIPTWLADSGPFFVGLAARHLAIRRGQRSLGCAPSALSERWCQSNLLDRPVA